MKHIYKSVFLATGLLSLTACSDFLDQSSPSEMNDKVVFNNEYYTELTLNKVYGGLTQDKTYSQFMPIQAGLNTDCELIDGLGSDAQLINVVCSITMLLPDLQIWKPYGIICTE